MTITSAAFMGFLFLVSVIFFICPVKYRWIILLLGSIVFYVAAGAIQFLPFLVFTSLVIWWCARQIGRLYEKQEQDLKAEGLDRSAKKAIRETCKKQAKRYLLIALISCIGILCVTKFGRYVVLYLNMISEKMHGGVTFSAQWILVPLGISYYTFSTVGYLLDVYWKRYSYETNFFRFLLYAIYFPHIVQGPISRYHTLGQELKKELRFDAARVVSGFELMLWGFFKKLVIADRLNIFVSAVYNGESHAGSIFLVAMLFDAFQIYTDFSGYTDIVRGISQIYGVELEQNFNHPFFSRTVPEYWRRWHMTMGGWFKDYVYYPCTISHFMKETNKKARKKFSERGSRFIAVVIPVFLTWVLTGLWHGTGMTYLCWGLYYSTLITISSAFGPEFEKATKLLKINTECYSWKLFQIGRTFCCFLGGRLLTRPGTLKNSLMVVKNMIRYFNAWHFFDGSLLKYGLGWSQMMIVFVSLIVLWAVDMMQERFCVREKLAQQNIVFRWLILYLAIFAVLILGIYGIGYDSAAFLYTQY